MNNDETTQENPQAQTSKGREPDYNVHQVIEGEERDNWVKIGAMWEGKNGYISGDTVHGRIVLQTRTPKEALDEMREQKQKSTQTLSQEPDTQPSQ